MTKNYKFINICKRILRDIVPPFLRRFLVNTRARVRAHHSLFYGNYSTWEEALSDSNAYSPSLNHYKAITDKIKSRNEPSGRNLMPILGGLLLSDGKVLDYGGNLGMMYFAVQSHNSKFITKWNVVDTFDTVKFAREHYQDDVLKFYDSLDDAVSAARPSMILCSHTLQYLESPYETLNALARLGADVIVLHELPISINERILLQRFPTTLGSGTFPARILSESKIAHELNQYKLICEINLPEWAPVFDVRQVARIYTKC